MTDRKDDMTALDDLLADMRAAPPDPSAALLARIVADGQAVQAGCAPLRQNRPNRGWFAQLSDALGGWPALGGLATATCAGVWLGVYPPQGMALAAQEYLGLDSVTPLVDMTLEGAFDLPAETM